MNITKASNEQAIITKNEKTQKNIYAPILITKFILKRFKTEGKIYSL